VRYNHGQNKKAPHGGCNTWGDGQTEQGGPARNKYSIRAALGQNQRRAVFMGGRESMDRAQLYEWMDQEIDALLLQFRHERGIVYTREEREYLVEYQVTVGDVRLGTFQVRKWGGLGGGPMYVAQADIGLDPDRWPAENAILQAIDRAIRQRMRGRQWMAKQQQQLLRDDVYIPRKPAVLARWKATWKKVRRERQKGTPVSKIADWLEKTAPDLTCSERTLGLIIKAGEAELLED
jgi:hypothetical protein